MVQYILGVMVRQQKWLIGIDEVGRGPLAGPITVAAVATVVSPKAPFLISYNRVNFKILQHIKNSKQLSAAKREEWREKIRTGSRFISTVTSVYPRTIDRVGITKAANKAVATCLKKLTQRSALRASRSLVVLDGGLYAPARYANQQTIIKGDEHHPLIAAASIIAKVHRDRAMMRLHKKLPRYGFNRHKGYGTKMHKEALERYGLSSYHRASFCKDVKNSVY